MTQILNKFKSKFSSGSKTHCPECGSELSKSARICPECGHNFLFKEEKVPQIFRISYNQETCCSLFLVILIAVALLFFAFPVFKTIFLILIAACFIALLIVLFYFTRFFFKIRKIFGF